MSKSFRLIIIIEFVLLYAVALCSCDSETPPDDYINTYDGCQIGDTIYKITGVSVAVYNAGSDTVAGLCRDPLCTHDSTDSLCPQSVHILFIYSITTDGKNIYIFMATDYNIPEKGEPRQAGIYIYSLSDFKMKKLCTVSATSNFTGRIIYYDGYIYYKDSYYNDNYDPSTGVTTQEDQYVKYMRVKSSGGKPEQIIDSEFSVDTALYVDTINYYLCDYLINNHISAYSRADGTKKDIGADGYNMAQVITYGGKTYIIGTGKNIEVTYSEKHILTPSSVFEYNPETGVFTLIAENISYGSVFSGDALWYSPFMADVQFYGTRQMPTGRSSETAPYDVFRFSTGEIVRLDLKTGERKTWNAGQDKYGQLEADIIGWSNGCLLTYLPSGERLFETGESDATVYKLTLGDDGTVTNSGSLGDIINDD